MITKEELELEHQEDLERLRNFRLLDDDFFTKCFEGDTACMELVLRIILEEPDLHVEEVRTQVFVENLLNRSVCLDILATDGRGRVCNIEIQRADKGAGRKRARYNSSAIDAIILRKGKDFDALPESYVIFITENDVIGKELPIYHVERVLMETDEPFGDGSHIIYVNGAYRSDSPIGKLMHDFFCKNPSDMHYKVLADRTRFFKEQEEGVAVMCKSMEDMRNHYLQKGIEEGIEKGREEGRKENVMDITKRMLEAGKYTLDEISNISGLSFDEIEQLRAE